MTNDDSDEEDSLNGANLELLRHLRNEARETVDQQISVSDDIDNKASQLLRINVLIVSAILTIVSISVRTDLLTIDDVLNPYSVTGIACLIFSTAFAGLTYTASDLEVGIAYREVREILKEDYSPQRYHEELVYGYANWMEFNDKTNIRNAPLITITILFVIYGISFLGISVAEAITDNTLSLTLVVVMVFFLLALTYFSGIVKQSRRWYAEVMPISTIKRKIKQTVTWLKSIGK